MNMVKKSVSILLAVIMVISVFTIVPITAYAEETSDNKINVFFLSPDYWGNNVKYYCWNSDGDYGTESWPGNDAQYLYTDNRKQSVWGASIPADVSGIIWYGNDGVAQRKTMNIDSGISDGAWWYVTDWAFTEEGTDIDIYSIATVNETTYHPAVEPTTTKPGNIAYY